MMAPDDQPPIVIRPAPDNNEGNEIIERAQREAEQREQAARSHDERVRTLEGRLDQNYQHIRQLEKNVLSQQDAADQAKADVRTRYDAASQAESSGADAASVKAAWDTYQEAFDRAQSSEHQAQWDLRDLQSAQRNVQSDQDELAKMTGRQFTEQERSYRADHPASIDDITPAAGLPENPSDGSATSPQPDAMLAPDPSDLDVASMAPQAAGGPQEGQDGAAPTPSPSSPSDAPDDVGPSTPGSAADSDTTTIAATDVGSITEPETLAAADDPQPADVDAAPPPEDDPASAVASSDSYGADGSSDDASDVG